MATTSIRITFTNMKVIVQLVLLIVSGVEVLARIATISFGHVVEVTTLAKIVFLPITPPDAITDGTGLTNIGWYINGGNFTVNS